MLSARDARRAERREEACGRRLLRRALRRRQAGQTLIILALTFSTMQGLSGLVVDVARAYDLYGKMQRAAEAGRSLPLSICRTTSPCR